MGEHRKFGMVACHRILILSVVRTHNIGLVEDRYSIRSGSPAASTVLTRLSSSATYSEALDNYARYKHNVMYGSSAASPSLL